LALFVILRAAFSGINESSVLIKRGAGAVFEPVSRHGAKNAKVFIAGYPVRDLYTSKNLCALCASARK